MTGSPTFVVIDAPTYTYTAFRRSSSNLNGNFTFGRIIYDAERQAIYLLENSEFTPVTDQIERYRFVNGAWVSDPPLTFPIPTSGGFDTFSTIALTPDGQQLLKSNLVTVSHIDPVAWTVTQTADGTGALGADGDLMKGAMSNDGSLILVGSLHTGDTIVRYDSVEQAFYPLPQPSGFQYAESHDALGSAEGDHVGFYFNGDGVTQSVYDYDAGTGTVTKNPNLITANGQVVSYSRDGTRVLLQGVNNIPTALIVPSAQSNTAYDIYPVSTVPMDSGVLSPDGNRIYAYDATAGLLHTLDAHTPPSGGVFAEIGSPVPVPDPPGLGHNMIITPDGGTLILGGNDHLVIMPAP